MNTSSTIELFSTLFGWVMYNNFYSTMNTMGALYVPFVIMLIGVFSEAKKKGGSGAALKAAAESLQYKAILAFMVFLMAMCPVMDLNLSGMRSIRPSLTCGASTTNVPGTNTGSTYQNAFSTLGGQTAEVPVWWGVVMAVSHGFSAASIAGMPCSADLRQYQLDMGAARITSPAVRQELQEFMQTCYFPSVGTIQKRDAGLLGSLNGPSAKDLAYMGSDTLLADDTYNQPIPAPRDGWRWNATRDVAWDNTGSQAMGFGHPTCAQWWNQTNDAGLPSLRQRLLNSVPADLRTQAKSNTGGGLRSFFGGASDQEIDDQLLKTVLVVNEGASTQRLNNDYAYGNVGDSGTALGGAGQIVGNLYNGAAATAGGAFTSLTQYPKMMMIREALPIAKAFMLMGIYMLLPFVVLFSGYSLAAVGTASVAIFALTFMDVLWGVCYWMDNRMLAAVNDGSVGSLLGLVWNPQTNMVLDFSIGMLYIGLPILWMTVLAWAGVKIGNGLNQFSENVTAPSGAAGKAGGELAGNAVSKGAKGALKK